MKRVLWVFTALSMLLAACAPSASSAESTAPASASASASEKESAAPMPLPSGPLAPALTNETWLNTEPLTAADLRGKVVLIDFWTFG